MKEHPKLTIDYFIRAWDLVHYTFDQDVRSIKNTPNLGRQPLI